MTAGAGGKVPGIARRLGLRGGNGQQRCEKNRGYKRSRHRHGSSAPLITEISAIRCRSLLPFRSNLGADQDAFALVSSAAVRFFSAAAARFLAEIGSSQSLLAAGRRVPLRGGMPLTRRVARPHHARRACGPEGRR